MKKKQYDVLSPDGFSISMNDVYNSKKEAKLALKEWMKRYEKQGYYSSNEGRISLNDLENCCSIVDVDKINDFQMLFFSPF